MTESGSILIYKTSSMNTANQATQTSRYEINNLGSVMISLDQPVSPMALPQEDASENVLVKMEGNTQTVTVNWKVIPETAHLLTSTSKMETSEIESDITAFYANPSNIGSSWSDNQQEDSGTIVGWLLNHFQGKDLSDRYMLKIPNIGIMEGFVTRLNANIDGSSPVIYNCSLTFTMGNVITIYETDAPSEVRNPSIQTVNASGGSTGTQTRIALTWSVPSDSASTITHYGIWAKDDEHSYTGEPSFTVAVDTTARDNELAGHVTGGSNYEVSFADPNETNSDFVKSNGASYSSGDWNIIRGNTLQSGKKYSFKIAASNAAGGYGLKSDEMVMTMP